jgi:DNA-binding NarL/FixJ family response regulator
MGVGSVLNVRPRSLETHRRNILGKLGVRNRTEMGRNATKIVA